MKNYEVYNQISVYTFIMCCIISFFLTYLLILWSIMLFLSL